MVSWPVRPIIYEINTWVWLNELSRRYERTITLGSIPGAVWDDLARLGVDAVWLMGVWERSPAGIRIATNDAGIRAGLHQALPDFSPEDNVGSPYCIRRYAVDPRLGGTEGLAVARSCLAARQIRLMLDFVPNHVAPDHPWVLDHPEYFITGDAGDLAQDPASFLSASGRILARGRDPNFPAWPDVVQLNAFHGGMRRAVADTLVGMAAQCDGLRCDMAMLFLNDVFEKTWGGRAGPPPDMPYWPEVIQAVREIHPHFLFLAEAYWDREWDLQQQGFDYCYDKRLYDRLVHEHAGTVRGHLTADIRYQDRLLRFIENHDEPRAATVFPPARGRAAALISATLPGACLFHEGQFDGRRLRLPVFLARRSDEPADKALAAFYARLLAVIQSPCLRSGTWRLCEVPGWPDNRTHENLLAWCWSKDNDHCLVVVNYGADQAQGRVQLPGRGGPGVSWRLTDLFTEVLYERNGDEIVQSGLYVDLPGWGFHVLAWQVPPAANRSMAGMASVA